MGTSTSKLSEEECCLIIKENISDCFKRDHFKLTDDPKISQLKFDYSVDLENVTIGLLKTEVKTKYGEIFKMLCPNGESDIPRVEIGNINAVYLQRENKFVLILKYKKI